MNYGYPLDIIRRAFLYQHSVFETGRDDNVVDPVPAHADNALLKQAALYPPLVEALLQLGDPDQPEVIARRAALGIDHQYVPDLVQMARDAALHESAPPTVWAPIHALWTLAGLDVSGVIADLLPVLDVDLEDPAATWNALPSALASAGEHAIIPLLTYVADRTRWSTGRAVAIEALGDIGVSQQRHRQLIIDVLVDVLCEAREHSPLVCTSAATGLLRLQAREAAIVIRRAYALNKIAAWVTGDWAET